jgi:CDP-diacylglycerol--glycerol-3-phosphate 3-phosphatidyltransferase
LIRKVQIPIMPTIYQLKNRFQVLLRPLVRQLAQFGVTANQITVTAMMLSIATGIILAGFADIYLLWLLLPLVLLVRMALNAMDGMLAREHDMQSPQGAILNELGDVVSDIALYLPVALLDVHALWLVVAICLLAVMSEMTGVVAVQIGASRRYDGPMGKSDRAFIFGMIGLLIGAGISPDDWLTALLALVLILLVVTIANRARRALEEIRGHE